MLIKTPTRTKTIHDYDFTALGGLQFSQTIDEEAGDYIDFVNDPIKVYIAPHPGLKEGTSVPAEETYIFRDRLISYTHTTREVEELTPEEKAEWNQTLKALSLK